MILKIVFATQLNEVIIGTSYKPAYTSDKSAKWIGEEAGNNSVNDEEESVTIQLLQVDMDNEPG